MSGQATLMPTRRPPPKRGRAWLYAPVGLLLLLAGLWSVAWWVIRDRTAQGLDAWIANEAAAGRAWTCADRNVGGYPVRIEITCGALNLARPGLTAAFGRLAVVAQIYQPRHVIAELGGPLAIDTDAASLTLRWRLFQASLLGLPAGFERFSVSTEAPDLRVVPKAGGMLAGSDFALSAEHLEFHARPDPRQAGAYQAALNAKAAAIPGLGELIGGQEAADLDLEVTATEIRDLAARPLPEEAERWRAAGGVFDITRLRLAKGPRRVEGRGRLGFDEAHRPMGQLDLATVRLDGLIGGLLGGGRGGAAGLLMGLLGGQPPRAEQPAPNRGSDTLKPLPPVRFANGRVQIGPIAIPGLRLPALY